jgi:hypothetical protein
MGEYEQDAKSTASRIGDDHPHFDAIENSRNKSLSTTLLVFFYYLSEFFSLE